MRGTAAPTVPAVARGWPKIHLELGMPSAPDVALHLTPLRPRSLDRVRTAQLLPALGLTAPASNALCVAQPVLSH